VAGWRASASAQFSSNFSRGLPRAARCCGVQPRLAGSVGLHGQQACARVVAAGAPPRALARRSLQALNGPPISAAGGEHANTPHACVHVRRVVADELWGLTVGGRGRGQQAHAIKLRGHRRQQFFPVFDKR